jgi:hypothetical protein
MADQGPKLTADNQGYWDRMKRARSWIERAWDFEQEVSRDGDPADGTRTSPQYSGVVSAF